MKFSPRTFKIQWDVHAWSGVAASILLFTVFYCGVFALFNDAFTHWQAPATAPRAFAAAPSQVSYDGVLREMERTLPIPAGATIMLRLPLGPRVAPGVSSVSVYHDASALQRDFAFDRITGALAQRDVEYSRLAAELYVLHFFYQLPWGVELSGIAAVALFVALISGLVIHWKDLLRQAWQFRPRLRLRFSASDAHKVLGVFGLPFTLLFAWSGAVLGLGSLLSAPLVRVAYGGDAAAFDAARGYRSTPAAELAAPVERPSLDALVDAATAAANAHFQTPAPLYASRLDVERHGEPQAQFQVSFANEGLEPQRSAVLDAGGHVLAFAGDHTAPSELIDRVLFDLHFGRFGGYLVKIQFALLSLAACAVIVTGNLIWLERRDPSRTRRGNRVLARLTVGACLGLVFASAVYCVSNRLLPATLLHRADVEFAVFIGAWLCSCAASLVSGTARSWGRGLSYAAALGFAGVVLGDVLTRPLHLGAAFAGDVDPALVANLVASSVGALCWGLGRGLRVKRAEPA